MIKQLGLKLSKYLSGKGEQPERKAVSFQSAKSIGVLINSPSLDYATDLNQFIQAFEKDGKKVKVICNAENQNQMYRFRFLPLDTKTDIGWKGEFVTEDIKNFIKTDFDYLYSINISPFLPFETILAKSHAKCRVGSNSDNPNLFELMIKLGPDEGFDSLIKRMKNYTEKIRNHE